jgi:hypothetical protein
MGTDAYEERLQQLSKDAVTIGMPYSTFCKMVASDKKLKKLKASSSESGAKREKTGENE